MDMGWHSLAFGDMWRLEGEESEFSFGVVTATATGKYTLHRLYISIVLYYYVHILILIEGSLEIKLQTIWRDGKAEV